MNRSERRTTKRGRLTAVSLFVLVASMVGLSFAAVPLYNMFCRATGYGGTPRVAEQGADHVLEQTITIRFDATVAGDLPWTVKPEHNKLTLKIGEVGQMVYLAHNLSGRPNVGTSSFNVSPTSAGAYFNKIQCFCFTEQPLEANADGDLGVTFFVDPAIVDDKDTRSIKEITLSYAFFPVKGAEERDKEKPVAAASDGADRQPL